MKYLDRMFAVYFADTPLNFHTTGDLTLTIPDHWDTKLMRDAERKSFWDKFEGSEGSQSAIITRNDFEKGAGDEVKVSIHSGVTSIGVSQGTILKGKEAKLTFSQFSLKVDWIRNAVAFEKRASKQSFISDISLANQELSTWLALRKDDDLFAQILGLSAQRHTAVAETATNTVLYPNAVTTVAGLGAADTFGVAEIAKMKMAMGRKLVKPISTMQDGKQLVEFYALVLDNIAAEYYLKSDPIWTQVQRDAGLRGDTNRLFTGALGQMDGVVVYSIQGKAGVGSFLRPEAVTSATSLANAEVLFAAATGRVAYQQYFPNGATVYQAVEALGTDNAVTMDAGAFTSRVDDETEIGKQYRLVAHTHDEYTSAGTIITQENHYASAIGFGAEVAARVWGKKPTPISDKGDYDFTYGVGIEAVYGCKVIEDLATKAKNHVILRHYCKNPYLGI